MAIFNSKLLVYQRVAALKKTHGYEAVITRMTIVES